MKYYVEEKEKEKNKKKRRIKKEKSSKVTLEDYGLSKDAKIVLE